MISVQTGLGVISQKGTKRKIEKKEKNENDSQSGTAKQVNGTVGSAVRLDITRGHVRTEKR
jgi:hypothetical protein